MPWCGVCLSVRPSVTFVDHVKTNKHTPGIQWYNFRPPGVTPNRRMGPPLGAFCQITLTSCFTIHSVRKTIWDLNCDIAHHCCLVILTDVIRQTVPGELAPLTRCVERINSACVPVGGFAFSCQSVCIGMYALPSSLAVNAWQGMRDSLSPLTDAAHVCINQSISLIAVPGPNSKWNASEIIHKNNKNQNKQHT